MKRFLYIVLVSLLGFSSFAQNPLPIRGFQRNFAAPLDSTQVWTNLTELQNYTSSVAAFPGQVLVYAGAGTTTVYALDKDKALVEIGGSGLTFDTSNLVLRDGSNSVTNDLDFTGNDLLNVGKLYLGSSTTNYLEYSVATDELTLNGEPFWFAAIDDTNLLAQITEYYNLVESNNTYAISIINQATQALAVATNYTSLDVYTPATQTLWLAIGGVYTQNFATNYTPLTTFNLTNQSLQTQINNLSSGIISDYVSKTNPEVAGDLIMNGYNIFNAAGLYFGGSSTNSIYFYDSKLWFNDVDLLFKPNTSFLWSALITLSNHVDTTYASKAALSTATNTLYTGISSDLITLSNNIDTTYSKKTDLSTATNTLYTNISGELTSLSNNINDTYTRITTFQSSTQSLWSAIESLPTEIPDPTNVVLKTGDTMSGDLNLSFNDLNNVRNLRFGSDTTNTLTYNGQDIVFNGQPLTSLATLPSAYVSHREQMFTGGSATLTLSNNPYAEEAIFLFLNSGAQMSPDNYSLSSSNQITLTFSTTTNDVIYVKYLSADGDSAVYVDKFDQYYQSIVNLYDLATNTAEIASLNQLIAQVTNFQYIANNLQYSGYRDEYFTGGSSAYALEYPPISPASVFVFLNSGAQAITNDYTVNGSTLLLGFSTTTNDSLLVKYLANFGNSPTGLVAVGGGGQAAGVFELDFFGGIMPKDISIEVFDNVWEYDVAGSIMPKDS